MRLHGLLIFLLPMLASAQAPPAASFDSSFFDVLRDNEIKERSSALQRARDETRFTNVTVRAPVQSELSGLTAIERAAVAIKTDIEDAEAGLQVAPFIGSGRGWSGLSLSLALLEEDVTQVGLGWAIDISNDEPLTYAELKGADGQPMVCSWDTRGLNQAIESAREEYGEVCDIPGTLPIPPLDQTQQRVFAERLLMARAACTGAGVDAIIDTPTFSWGKAQLVAFFRYYEHLLESAAPPLQAQARVILGSGRDAIDAIKAFEFGPFEDCPGAEELKAAIELWRRQESSLRLGFGVQSQFFPWVGGFDPECEGQQDEPGCQKDKLSFKQVQPRAEVAAIVRGVNLTLGLGLAFSREARGEELTPALALALATDWPLTSPLRKDAPRVVLGLEASARLSLDKPAVQKELISEGQITPYLAVEVSDELSFRLGVPLRAELATREADEANQIPEMRSLQWSVPAFIATVLRLD
jgi:hypothetical protein